MPEDKLIIIRKAVNWKGQPVWRWRCTGCPREKGRRPKGGDHRVSTFTSRNRGDKYPPAFERCKRAALLHAHRRHNPLLTWNKRVREAIDELCRVST